METRPRTVRWEAVKIAVNSLASVSNSAMRSFGTYPPSASN